MIRIVIYVIYAVCITIIGERVIYSEREIAQSVTFRMNPRIVQSIVVLDGVFSVLYDEISFS